MEIRDDVGCLIVLIIGSALICLLLVTAAKVFYGL